MIYASSKDRFKRELDGIQIELQATDPTEMDLDVFKSRANWMNEEEIKLFRTITQWCFFFKSAVTVPTKTASFYWSFVFDVFFWSL